MWKDLRLDDSREKYGFLQLTFDDSKLKEWWIAYGNAQKTTRIEHDTQTETRGEIDTLQELNKELRNCRDKEIRLIIYDQESMKLLRSRLLVTKPDLGAPLRQTEIVALKQDLISQFSGFNPRQTLEQACKKAGAKVSPEEVEANQTISLLPEESIREVLLLRALYTKTARIASPSKP